MRFPKATRYLSLAIAVSLALVLTGCPKSTPSPDIKTPTVTSRTDSATTPRTGDRPGDGGGGSVTTPPKPPRFEDQLAANQGRDVPLSETPRQTFIDPVGEEREVLRTIFFDYDRSDIREEYRPALEAIAAWMNRNPSRLLLVEGHCDERGTNEYNLALGERRALSVRRYLVALGIGSDRLHTLSYGEEKPLDPGHTEESWAKNRRAEFKVSQP
jgi:peptidoglycan-associated lipoprotein